MFNDYFFYLLGLVIGTGISVYGFVGTTFVLLYALVYSKKRSEEENERATKVVFNVALLFTLSFLTLIFIYDPITIEYKDMEFRFQYITVLALIWGIMATQFIVRLFTSLMTQLFDYFDQKLKMALRYEDHSRQALISIKTRKGDELITAWVKKETPKYLYVEDETGREHRIKKGLVGHGKYRVLEVRHIINAI